MATWTSIPDSLLEPGKPIRSVDALALRDNPIAIAEGAAGAPKVTENAMNANSIHGNRIRSGTVANAQIANGAVNNVKIANMDAGKLNSGTVPGARIPTGNGGVGTYAFVIRPETSSVGWGATTAGSSIYTSGTDDHGGPRLSGTWRIMGRSTSTGVSTLAVRIS